MRVSFVLPVWKGKYLRDAIKSILAQTFRDFELIVVDDSSPDNIEKIIEDFSDSRLVYRRNEENIGKRDLAQAWNLAMSYARGEYAVLASDDDIYERDFLETMVALADSRKDVDLFHSRLMFIDSECRDQGFSELRKDYETPAEFLYARTIERKWQFVPEFLFRLEAFRKIGGFVSFPRAWYTDDATWFKLSERGGVVYSPRVLFRWRRSGENISSTFTDIGEKFKAASLYKKWISEYIAKLKKTLVEKKDADLINLVERKVYDEIDHLSFWLLHNAKFADAIKASSYIEGGIVGKLEFGCAMIKAAMKRLCCGAGKGRAR